MLWDEHPLRLGATPIQVWIDGSSLLNNSCTELAKPTTQELKPPSQWKYVSNISSKESCQIGARDLVIKGLSKSFLKDFQAQEGNNTLILEDGRITCIGKCSTEEGRLIEKGASTIVMRDGYVVPVSRPLSRLRERSEISP